MKINCNVSQDLMQLYVEDTLSIDSRELLEKHLSECEVCRVRLDDIRKINEELDNKEEQGDAGKSTSIEEAGTFKSFKRWLDSRRCITAAVTTVLIMVLLVVGYYYGIEYETYVSYEDSGLIVTESGDLITNKPYKRSYEDDRVLDFVDGRYEEVGFIWITSSLYTRKQEPEYDYIIVHIFPEKQGTMMTETGEEAETVLKEVYYVPEKYVVESDNLNNKHGTLIPIGISREEELKLIEEIKSESVLIWQKD